MLFELFLFRVCAQALFINVSFLTNPTNRLQSRESAHCQSLFVKSVIPVSKINVTKCPTNSSHY